MISLNAPALTGLSFILFNAFYAVVFIYTCYCSPWGKLKSSLGLQHLCFGASVILMMIWSVNADVAEGVSIHFLGMTALTLVMGWDLAIVCASVALVVTTLSKVGIAGLESLHYWNNFAANGVITIVLPVVIAQLTVTWAQSNLPKNFFVYLFVCGFFCAGLTAVLVGFAVSLTLLFGDVYPWLKIQQDVVSIIVLTVFPEGLLNGILLTAIMVFYPDWIRSFDAKAYIDDQ